MLNSHSLELQFWSSDQAQWDRFNENLLLITKKYQFSIFEIFVFPLTISTAKLWSWSIGISVQLEQGQCVTQTEIPTTFNFIYYTYYVCLMYNSIACCH